MARKKTNTKVIIPTGGWWYCAECCCEVHISRFELENTLEAAKKTGAPGCCGGPMAFVPADRMDRHFRSA